jgi:thymus-specific serine protease
MCCWRFLPGRMRHCLSFRQTKTYYYPRSFFLFVATKLPVPTYHRPIQHLLPIRISSNYGSVEASVFTSGSQIVGHIRYEQLIGRSNNIIMVVHRRSTTTCLWLVVTHLIVICTPGRSVDTRHHYRGGWKRHILLRQQQSAARQQTTSGHSPPLRHDDDDADAADDDNDTRQQRPQPYAAGAADVQEHYFRQTLDHFALEDRRTFDQRYFERLISSGGSSTSHNHAGGGHQNGDDNDDDDDAVPFITFLCVGGEGPPLDASVLIDSVHCTGDMIETAQMVADGYGYNVQLLALEHRFYGHSYPFTNSSDLSLLSSRQAVEDLAHFAHSVAARGATNNHNDDVVPAAVVYLFGGSYPGMLAAFARTKYPFRFAGAVSNSAPVQARLDFHEYQDHVGRDLPVDCFHRVKEGHNALVVAVTAGSAAERVAIAQQFRFCNETALESRRNQELFLGDGAVYLSAQADDPSCPGTDTNFTNQYCNLRQQCHFITDMSVNRTAVEALADLAALELDGECLDIDWEGVVSYNSNVTNDESRSWLWQTCTEFGFYQTCTTDACPYGTGFHRVEQDMELCRRAFGVDVDEHIIERTNEWSGGWNVPDDHQRILSVVGTVDPWTELAVRTAILVDGASHHFWTHPTKDTDSSAVVDARRLIMEQVLAWIDEDIATTTTVKVDVS